MAEDSADVLEELNAAHRRVAGLLSQLLRVPPGEAERKQRLRELANVVRDEMALEEEQVYPAVRRCCREGHRAVEREMRDHETVRTLLRRLEGRETDAADFDQLLTILHNRIKSHARDEQTTIFPLLRRCYRRVERQALGARLRRTRAATTDSVIAHQATVRA